MYKVLDKDIIEPGIVFHLSMTKRDFNTRSYLTQIINCILYKLKIGIQWEFLLVESLSEL